MAVLGACALLAADASLIGARAGLLDELFGGDNYHAPPPPEIGYSHNLYPDRIAPAPGRVAPKRSRARTESRLTGSVSTDAASRAHKSRPLIASLETSSPRSELGRFVCVRLCDGAVVSLAKRSDEASQKPTCETACPGAETRLYTLPQAGDDMAKAADDENNSYAALIARIKQKSDAKSCACASTARQDIRVDDFFDDATLRKGDVVATADGLQVFHGSRRLPHRDNEFLALDEAHGQVSKSSRSVLFAIDHKLKSAN